MRESNSQSGDNGKVVTPVPIPNTEVKHFSGEDSYACHSENSSSPGNEAPPKGAFFLRSGNLREGKTINRMNHTKGKKGITKDKDRKREGKRNGEIGQQAIEKKR